MRSRLNWAFVFAAGLSSAWGCSDDGADAMSTRFENQGGAGGTGSSETGASVPSASTGGSSSEGSSSEGGSVPPGGLSGNGTAAGESRDAGLASVPGADAGAVDAGATRPAPDAGAPPVVEEPDDDVSPPPPPPPPPASVTFGDVFPLLVANCGNCHGATAPGNRPRFAQAGNQAASFTATQGMSGGGVVSARIVVRGVVNRNMPPACQGNALGTGSCLDIAEGASLQAWLNQGAQQ